MPKDIKAPNKKSLASTSYVYLDLPKGMDECFYDLELAEFKMTKEENKYVAVFKVLDTDTKVRKGTMISHLMDPYQKFAETYFWRDVFTIYATCRGKEPTRELLEKLADKHQAILDKLIDGKGVGGSCNVQIRSYEKDGKTKTQKTWAVLSTEE
jgi:hypothetical protein